MLNKSKVALVFVEPQPKEVTSLTVGISVSKNNVTPRHNSIKQKYSPASKSSGGQKKFVNKKYANSISGPTVSEVTSPLTYL